MEIKLKDGDYVKAVDGTLETVSGDEKLLQGAKMRLFTKRGAFCYAPSFGSRLAELSPDAGQQAFVFAQEALAPMLPNVQVLSAEAGENGVTVRVHAGQTEQKILVPYAENGVCK